MGIDSEIRNMLNQIRSKGILTEEKDNGFVIGKSTPQFSDVRNNQEADLVKTIGERVELDNDALVYYPQTKDLVLVGNIPSISIKFQFRYNDPSGVGCYIWANSLQMTDTNVQTVSKIKAAFDIWKQKLDEDGDLIERLAKTNSEENN